jgi:hypothetical protein
LSLFYSTLAFQRMSCCRLPPTMHRVQDIHVSGVRSLPPVSIFLQFKPKLTFVSKASI